MKGNLKALREGYTSQADGDVKKGIAMLSNKIVETLQDPKFDVNQFSIREAFDNIVLASNPDLDLNDKGKVQEAVGSSVFPYMTSKLISKEVIPAYELNMFGADQLVTESSTTRVDYEYVAGMRAITKLPRVREGQPYPTANIGEKNIRVEMAKFGEILEITSELVLADQTGQILERARAAGDMMGEHRHRFIIETVTDQAREALEESSSTSLFYNGSARDIYSANHATIDGQTNVNYSSGVTLDTDGLNTAYRYLGTMKDEKGRYITVMPKQLLVHPAKFPDAWKFCTNLTQPDTTERADNFYARQLRITPYSSPYVALETTWYLGDFKKQFVWLWVNRPEVLSEGSTSTAAFERDVIARFRYGYYAGIGARDYRFVVENVA
jgi:hypothetical protein